MILDKKFFSSIVPACIWNWLRMRGIVAHHKKVVSACELLIDSYYTEGPYCPISPKVDLGSEKVIWQYWAQGYEDVPDRVGECLASVERYAEGYQLIRLSDANISDYLNIPEFVKEKRKSYTIAHFSDLLRLMLLSTYGGIWLDATVMLSGQIPGNYATLPYFMYQRDPQEKNKEYWANTYAYYFGWVDGFRVNVLNSIIFARKESIVIETLSALMLKWWKENDSIPDYFFFQILYDVLINGKMKEYKCPIVSDCCPHYLQQSYNDPDFNLMSREEILMNIPIHKLTYK